MGHTSGALRSRNFAFSARGLRPDGKNASMRRGCARKRQPNVPGCLGWSPGEPGHSTGHTGHADAQRHSDHTDEPHNHPNPQARPIPVLVFPCEETVTRIARSLPPSTHPANFSPLGPVLRKGKGLASPLEKDAIVCRARCGGRMQSRALRRQDTAVTRVNPLRWLFFSRCATTLGSSMRTGSQPKALKTCERS